MEQRITLYIAFWGCLISSGLSENHIIGIMWFISAVICALVWWILSFTN